MTTPRPTPATASTLQRLRARLTAGPARQLGKRASWSMAIEVLQLTSSTLVFLVLANLLSKQDYGVMSGVLGLAAPAAALTTFGTHILLIKRVAHDGDLRLAWQRATSIGILGPAAGAAVLIAAKPLLLPAVDTTVYVLLVLAQLNFFWLSELALFIGNATRCFREVTQIRFVVVFLRLAALGMFALFGAGDLRWWAVASAVSFGLGAVASLWLVRTIFGARPSLRRGRVADLREGLPFSINSGSESLFDMSDRALLTRYGLTEDNAIYSVAARIIQFGYLPMSVLLRATDADVYSAAKRGVGGALRASRRLLPPGVGVALLVSLAFLVAAPLVPLVVPSYEDAVPAIRLLAVLPIIRAVQYVMGNCLSASGHQWWRVAATLAAFALNFGLNVRYLPTGTWRTAIYTTLVSEVFLTVILIVVVFGLSWREGDRVRSDG